jgi:hypothetical protein
LKCTSIDALSERTATFTTRLVRLAPADDAPAPLPLIELCPDESVVFRQRLRGWSIENGRLYVP